jgi:hypothetical protein
MFYGHTKKQILYVANVIILLEIYRNILLTEKEYYGHFYVLC